MSATPPASHHYQRAAEGLDQLATLMRAYPELVDVQVEEDVDLTDSAEVDRLAAQNRRDAELALVREERERRAEQAGAANIAARCECGHSAINHADTLVDGSRIPCAADGCPCEDLLYTAPEGT